MAKRVTGSKAARPAARPPSKPLVPPARKTPAKWTERKRERFIGRLAETANVAESARAVKMSRTAAYAERRRNAEFATAWDAAINIALDELELLLLDRAMHGTDKTIVYHGEPRGTIKEYSEALAMFILRAHRKDIYGKDAVSGAPQGEEELRALIEARINGLKRDEGGA